MKLTSVVEFARFAGLVWMVSLLQACAAADPPASDEPAYKAHVIEVQKDGGVAAFSADSKLMAVSGGNEIRVYEVPGGKEHVRMQMPDKNYTQPAFAADGKHLITVSSGDKTIRFWSLASGKQTRELELPAFKKLEWVVGFSPGGGLVAIKLEDRITLVDTATGKVAVEFEGAGPGPHSFKTKGGAFTRDGKRFVAGAGKGRVGVWDVATGKQKVVTAKESQWLGHGEFCYVALSPDEKWIATANGGVTGQPVEVWDIATCERLATPVKADGYCGPIAWTSDGTAVVYTDYQGVRAIDVATGKAIHEFQPPGGAGKLWAGVWDATPDGKYLSFNIWNSSLKSPSVVLFSMPPARKPEPPKAKLTRDELDGLWNDLTTDNKILAERNQATMSAAAVVWVPFVLEKLQPANEAEIKKLQTLIEGLDAEAPAARTAAQDKLASVAHRYEFLLNTAYGAAAPGEIRNRLKFLLSEVKDKPQPVDLVTELRAVEVLAKMNTPESRKALQTIADRDERSRVTRAAKAAIPKP